MWRNFKYTSMNKEDLRETVERFHKETGYELTIKDGKLFYDGDIDLTKTVITELPDNLTVMGHLILNKAAIKKLPNTLTTFGCLFLYVTDITKLPDNLKVGENLVLIKTKITELPDNLIVGGNLRIVNGYIEKLPNNLIVGGYIELSNTNITKLPYGLTVGSYLLLNNTKIIELPDNLTVNGNMYIHGTSITSFPDNLKVHGYISVNERVYVPKNNHICFPEKRGNTIFWERDSVKYIKADGILSVIESHHGNVYRVHKIGQEDKQLYLITDGNNHWAHGATLEEARADLIYKINDRDTSGYKHLSLDDTLSYEGAIAAYRSITGACSAGTRDFIENRLPSPHKDKYTVKEIIELTTGEYGGEKFEKFFK